MRSIWSCFMGSRTINIQGEVWPEYVRRLE